MTKLLKVFGVAAAVGLAAPSQAAAVFNWSGCGGQNFASCATVVATWDGVNTLSFSVTNDMGAGWPGVFTEVGWNFNIIPTAGVTDPVGGNWSFGSRPAIGGGYYGMGANPPPVGPHAISAGKTLSFKLTFAAEPDWSSFTFGLREQSLESYWDNLDLNCAGSNRLEITKTGAVYTEAPRDTQKNDAACWNDPDFPPIDVVPEPATMVLLATGLIGLTGAQLRRRKNMNA